MSKVNPFIGLFVAIVAAMAAILIPVFLLLRDEIARVDTGLRAEIIGVRGEFSSVRGEVDGVRGELAATNERMARVEGAVAGALGRPWPERMAQAPEPETGVGG